MSKFSSKKKHFETMNNSIDNTKNVQLHEIIKNSLATYLSYKWSSDKLYLKKRKKRELKEDKKKKTGLSLERQHSVINLENNVFIYDAANKTFTQLDLCECFKNGVKYRKIDPFSTKNAKKNYELCEVQQNNSSADSQDYESYQVVNVGDSVERIFSNNMLKKGNWTKTIDNLCPSKFDLFVQKELNKCTAKNFDVKSFKINTKQETSSSSNDKVCSSAAIGYYTITTYDDNLQCGNQNNNRKGRKLSTKQCNFIGIREETISPKNLYSKGVQCKLSNHRQRKEKSSADFGVQCFYNPGDHAKFKLKKPQIEETLRSTRYIPVPKQKIDVSKKLRKKHGSFSDIFPAINSSAEIRRILNASQSDSSLSLSNNGEFFRNCMGPKPLLTYYNTSSTSKGRGGETNDDQYIKNEPIYRMAASEKDQFGTMVVKTRSENISPICSIHCKKNEIIPRNPICKCSHKKGKPEPVYIEPSPVRKVCSSKCTGPCTATRKSTGTITCLSECPCPGQKITEKRDPTGVCICPPPPVKACCECNKASVSAACICDLLCNLRERIKKQTEEQNRNLDQILEELDKQDKEIQLIRQFVEKSKKSQKKEKCCTKKNAVCSCYTATIQYDFNPFPTVNLDEDEENNFEDSLEDENDDEKSPEPEIIQLYGSKSKSAKKKILEKESLKGLWKKNSRNFFSKRNNPGRKKDSSSSFSPAENVGFKKENKEKKEFKWFSKLVSSKKDVGKNHPDS